MSRYPTRKAKERYQRQLEYKKARQTSPDNKRDEDCIICLERIKCRGKLSICDHWFCFICIYEWSKNTNTCPLCKGRFRCITKYNLQQNGSPPRQYRVNDRDQAISNTTLEDYELAMELENEESESDDTSRDADYSPEELDASLTNHSHFTRAAAYRNSFEEISRNDVVNEFNLRDSPSRTDYLDEETCQDSLRFERSPYPPRTTRRRVKQRRNPLDGDFVNGVDDATNLSTSRTNISKGRRNVPAATNSRSSNRGGAENKHVDDVCVLLTPMTLNKVERLPLRDVRLQISPGWIDMSSKQPRKKARRPITDSSETDEDSLPGVHLKRSLRKRHRIVSISSSSDSEDEENTPLSSTSQQQTKNAKGNREGINERRNLQFEMGDTMAKQRKRYKFRVTENTEVQKRMSNNSIATTFVSPREREKRSSETLLYGNEKSPPSAFPFDNSVSPPIVSRRSENRNLSPLAPFCDEASHKSAPNSSQTSISVADEAFVYPRPTRFTRYGRFPIASPTLLRRSGRSIATRSSSSSQNVDYREEFNYCQVDELESDNSDEWRPRARISPRCLSERNIVSPSPQKGYNICKRLRKRRKRKLLYSSYIDSDVD